MRPDARPRGAVQLGLLIGIVIAAVIGLAVLAGLSPGVRTAVDSTVRCMTSFGQRCGGPSGDERAARAEGAPAEAGGSSFSASDVARWARGQIPIDQQLAVVDEQARRADEYLSGLLDSARLSADDREFAQGVVDGAVGTAAFVARLGVDPVRAVADAVRPWVTAPLETAHALWDEIRDRPLHALGGFVAGFGAGKLLTLPLKRLPPGALARHEPRPGESGCVGGACTGGRSCFAAGTLVDTVAGPRAIESIVPGELVRSRDPETGVDAYKPVVRTFVTRDRAVEELAIAGDDGATETVTVTPEHPFFVDGRGWVAAADLEPARDTIRSAAGARVRVVAALLLAATSTVYNLEVGDFHTYFVGHAHAWVHNQCAPPGGWDQPAHVAITRTLFGGEIIDGRPFNAGVAHGHPLWQVKLRDRVTGEERDALFKPRNLGDDGGNDVTPFEYTAYELNRLLAMDYVPPVAYRRDVTLGGHTFSEGAILYKVPGVKELKSIPRDKWSFNAELFESDTRILDVLLQNADRHAHNVLYGRHWTDGAPGPVLIDHAGSFKQGNQVTMTQDWLFPGLPNFNGKPVLVIRRRTYEALRAISFDEAKRRIGAFRSDGEIGQILRRRDGILRYFEERARRLGEKNVIIDEEG